MIFQEVLPDCCPPNDSVDEALSMVYRAYWSDSLTATNFVSHGTIGKPMPKGCDPCRWYSCSLLLDPIATAKLPKFKQAKFAKLDIPKGYGMSKKVKNHVDFWVLQGCDLSKTLVEVLS
jgi:hypothetical protein